MERIAHFRPTKEDLEAARNKTVKDVIAPGLDLLFCGINPGLYTAAIGHHFGRPGNRFWPALYVSGFTERLLSPYEERELLNNGYGITNIVARTTLNEQELSDEELIEGVRILEKKVRRYRPGFVAILGIGAYRRAFRRPDAAIGSQSEDISGACLWVLPNPSGLNTHYLPSDLKRLFTRLRLEIERSRQNRG